MRNTRNTHMCVCVSAPTCTHTRITPAHALHNLCTQFNLFEPCCLPCHGYRADTRLSASPHCRHTFLWFAAWLQQPASCNFAAVHKTNGQGGGRRGGGEVQSDHTPQARSATACRLVQSLYQLQTCVILPGDDKPSLIISCSYCLCFYLLYYLFKWTSLQVNIITVIEYWQEMSSLKDCISKDNNHKHTWIFF